MYSFSDALIDWVRSQQDGQIIRNINGNPVTVEFLKSCSISGLNKALVSVDSFQFWLDLMSKHRLPARVKVFPTQVVLESLEKNQRLLVQRSEVDQILVPLVVSDNRWLLSLFDVQERVCAYYLC